jgi:3-hydroxybutyryl-CoA dehydrogenase
VIRRIAVLGAGTMGHGIAHAAVAAGYETCLFDVSQEIVERGRSAVETIVRKGVDLGKVAADDADRALQRLTTATEISHALGNADFIIEAAPEQIGVKLKLFADIDRLAPPQAIVTSNTSALSITEMAGTLATPSRVAGMHFFNPVHKMKLVEIVRALETAPSTLAAVEEVAGEWGRRRWSCASRRDSSRRV